MKRVMCLLIGCAATSSCYILSGDVACNVDADCPEDVPFCIDIDETFSGDRVCAAAGNAACSTSADGAGDAEGNIFCTRDPDLNVFCTNFCDAENVCFGDERCVGGGCEVRECAENDDCQNGESCLND